MVNAEENAKLKRIRFEQRFANFEKAYAAFENILSKDTEHDVVARTALIQAFEFTFELAWKAMKDKIESEEEVGEEVIFAIQTLQHAYDAKYITDMDTWTAALKNRNASSHAYEEKFAVELEKFIRLSYAPVLNNLHEYFKRSLNK